MDRAFEGKLIAEDVDFLNEHPTEQASSQREADQD